MALSPHHDGSELYVSCSTPRLGDVVRVRVRIPVDAAYGAVRIRSTYDADIHVESAARIMEGPRGGVVAARAGTDDGVNDGFVAEDWYEAPLLVHNPVTRYRFMLMRADGGFDWLNATGVHRSEVSDSDDFIITTFTGSPSWNVDGAVYQIFPDRFCASGKSASRTPPPWAIPTAWGVTPLARGEGSGRQWYGGDLDGIRSRLDYIRDLGFTTVYLTPFFTAGSVHRYDASTFRHVDPLLGGDEALASLARECHRKGLRLVGDLTLNHTGSGHEWFRRALADPDSPERKFYMWRSYPDDYVAWMGVPSLPKLDWSSRELRERMIDGPDSVVGRWLGGSDGLDGWRIDVANQTGRYGADDLNLQVARSVRETVDGCTGGDGVLIAEHMHDPQNDLDVNGWQGVMNYAGFSRPIWTWLCDPGNTIDYMGLGVNFCRRRGVDAVSSMREFLAHVSWKTALSHWNNLDSHDTARIATLIGDERLVAVAVGLLMAFPGVPMVFAGDECGAVGSTGEESRVSMDWESMEGTHGTQGTHAIAVMETYRRLLGLRRACPALRSGGLRWAYADDDSFAFLREDADDRILVTASRTDGRRMRIDSGYIGSGRPRLLYGDGHVEDLPEGRVFVHDRASVCLWRLDPLRVPHW